MRFFLLLLSVILVATVSAQYESYHDYDRAGPDSVSVSRLVPVDLPDIAKETNSRA